MIICIDIGNTNIKTALFDGLRRAVLDAGDRIVFADTYVLHLARKPR